MRTLGVLMLFTLGLAALAPAHAADRIPACRTDDSSKILLAETLERAIGAYQGIGKGLAVQTVVVNPAAPASATTLTAYIIRDAAQGKVTSDGCISSPLAKGDALDELSVRGGCVVSAIGRLEIRCSSEALKLFGNVGQRSGVANPSLLYVLGHELAHIYQRRLGEYAGRVEAINLQLEPEAKLKLLREACDPVSVKREAEADAMSLEVLAQLLARPPYRETVFSERGSLYWNIDQLALASDAWQRVAQEREFISQPQLHPAFVPTEFPTPGKVVETNAQQFVCQVMTKRRRSVLYPGKSVTHPPLEQRLRHIAEALRPVAERLPASGEQEEFKPVARLQEGLSPIFTHIYRETGVYLEAVQSRICTIVNAPDPVAKCR
jgi:hypothetical protein